MATQDQLNKLQEYTQVVHRIVGGFQKKLPRNVLRDDLLAAGMAGLWDAIQRHTGDDRKFEWYARVKIRGAILDELRAQDWLPRRLRWLMTEDTSLTVVRLEDIANAERDKALSYEPTLKSEQNQQRDRLAKALAKLPKRDQDVVALHDFQGATLKDIADTFGVSEPRICQIRSRALKQLRTLMAEA